MSMPYLCLAKEGRHEARRGGGEAGPADRASRHRLNGLPRSAPVRCSAPTLAAAPAGSRTNAGAAVQLAGGRVLGAHGPESDGGRSEGAGRSASGRGRCGALSRSVRGCGGRGCRTPLRQGSSIPCTLCKCFALDRKILTTAAGYRAGSNHSIPVPPSTYGGVVPRPGSRDGCPVGSLRHRAPVQGLAGIAAEPSLSSDTFTREEAW